MLKYVFILSFLFSANLLEAQSPIYNKIGEETFWNKDIYTLLYAEDSEILYVGTNSGLYVYKENTFTQLKGPKNQIGFSFFNLQQNKKGDIFCNNLNGQVFKLNPESETFELYYQLNKSNIKGGQMWCYFTPENHLLMASKYSISVIDTNKNLIGNYTKIVNKKFYNIIKVDQIKDQIFIEFSIKDKSNTLNLVSYSNGEFKFHSEQQNKPHETSSGFMLNNNRPFSLNKRGKINYSKSIIQDFESLEMERYTNINDTCLLALNAQNGYRFLSLYQDTVKSSEIILPNTFISAFYQTSAGQFILGTFGDGIFVVSNPKIRKYEHDLLFLDLACSPNNKVAFSTRSGEVLQLENNTLKQIDKMGHHIDHLFYSENNKQAKVLGYSDFIYCDIDKIGAEIRDYKTISEDVFIYSDFSGIRIYIDSITALKTNLDVSFSNLILENQRYKSLEWNAKDSLIYYSTNLGVYSKKWSKKQSTPLLFNTQQFSTNDLYFAQSKLYCATNLHGLLIFQNNTLIKQIDASNGLHSNLVKQVLIQNGKLFILTNKGLQLYGSIKKSFVNLKHPDAYERVTKMALSKDKLWLLEKHGYFSVPLSQLESTKLKSDSLKIFINQIEVNNSEIDFEKKSDMLFSYDENRFEITYDYRHIFNKNKTKVYYKLEGLNENWKMVSPHKNKILFQSLLPGEYLFKIKAESLNSTVNLKQFSFEIKPPYWQTWWFYLAIFTFIISGVSLYFIRRIRLIKIEENKRLEKHKLITQTIDSELKAIRAQMNPHFIFNAINSIQDLVLQNDTLKSYDALVQFSKLVRNTLDYSEKEFIYLSQEIEFLNTYLGLERLRFKTNFDYTLDNQINRDIRIPSIVIQPFVENAIKHGLLHKSGQKNLNIVFEIQNNQLLCTVTDNGIGLTKSKAIKNRQKLNHTSFSTNAISKRLEILEQKVGQKCYYTSDEVFDEHNNVLGTCVKVYLPVIE